MHVDTSLAPPPPLRTPWLASSEHSPTPLPSPLLAACTVQAGCETSFAYCSIDKPTELACLKAFDDYILSETDIVEPVTRRLRGE